MDDCKFRDSNNIEVNVCGDIKKMNLLVKKKKWTINLDD